MEMQLSALCCVAGLSPRMICTSKICVASFYHCADYYGYQPKDPFVSVNDVSNGVRGMCAAFKTRENVTSQIRCPKTGKVLCSMQEAEKL